MFAVKFIFNKISCEKQDSLKPKLPSTSGSDRQNSYKKEEECHKRLASKKFTFVEERSNKDYSRLDDDLTTLLVQGEMITKEKKRPRK